MHYSRVNKTNLAEVKLIAENHSITHKFGSDKQEKRAMIKIICLLLVAVFHPAVAQPRGPVDWAKKVKQFNLHDALTARHHGESDTAAALRLAKNAHRLGNPTQAQRDLISFEIPSDIIDAFDGTIEEPRLLRDAPVDQLPFQSGPGVIVGLPPATEAFWKNQGQPTQMWEVVACPVVDVVGYYANPLRCVFGDVNTQEADLIFGFLEGLADEAIGDLISSIVVPLLSGIASVGADAIDFLISPLCDLIGFIEDIFDAVESIVTTIISEIEGAIESAGNFLKDVENVISNIFTDIGDFFDGIPQLFEDLASDFASAIATAVEDAVKAALDALNPLSRRALEALRDSAPIFNPCQASGDPCANHDHTCYQPISDLDGVCTPSAVVELIQAGEIPMELIERLHVLMGAAHIENNLLDPQVSQAFSKVFGASGGIDIMKVVLDAMSKSERNIKEDLKELRLELLEQVNEVKDECSSTDDEGDGNPFLSTSENNPGRRLQMDQTKLRGSPEYQKIKETASKQGLTEGQVLSMFDRMLGAVEGLQTADEASIAESPAYKEVEARILKMVEEEKKAKVSELLEDTIRGAFQQNIGMPNRMLMPESIADQCRDFRDGFQKWLEDSVNGVIEDLVEVDGGYISFLRPVFREVNPFVADSALNDFLRTVIEAVQDVTSLFLFGCTNNEPSCEGVLPSQKNEVIDIREGGDGNFYLFSGCDGNFEGELLFSIFALNFLEEILDLIIGLFPSVSIDVGGSLGIEGTVGAEIDVIAYIAAPVKFIFNTIKGIQTKLDETCGYLDAYVEFVKIEATLENTRWALRELACVPVEELKKGNGCDGVDNNCDADAAIDECAEDVVPPEFLPLALPDSFESLEAAQAFVEANLVVVDDCLFDITTTFVTNLQSQTSSSTTYEIIATAVARGCGERTVEDQSTKLITVKIKDIIAPTVSCSFGVYGLTGKKPKSSADTDTLVGESYPLVDVGLAIAASDDFNGELSYKVTVLANEIDKEKEIMALFQVGGIPPTLFVSDETCSSSCPIQSNSEKKSRTYRVQVEATDESGNTGSATCDLLVSYQETESAGGPFFAITSMEYSL